MAKNKKVCCKNCKYLTWLHYCRNYKFRQPYWNVWGGCFEYKRKWYKFWVKDK